MTCHSTKIFLIALFGWFVVVFSEDLGEAPLGATDSTDFVQPAGDIDFGLNLAGEFNNEEKSWDEVASISGFQSSEQVNASSLNFFKDPCENHENDKRNGLTNKRLSIQAGN